jgi:hypothetical protein
MDENALDSLLAHALVGEPDSTSPEHALTRWPATEASRRIELANPDFRMGFDGMPWDFERQTGFGRPNRRGSARLSNGP